MAPRSASGLASHSANSREPIGVVVRSITANSEPSRRPSRRVRVNSRLRRVASSICSRLSAGNAPADQCGTATIFASRPDSRAPRRPRRTAGRWQSSKPNPSKEATSKCRLASTAWSVWALKAQAGRRVTSSFSPVGGCHGSSSASSTSACADPRQLVGQTGRRKTGGREPPGRQINPGHAGRLARDHRRQVVARAGVE